MSIGIQIENIRKSYSDVEALKDISLEVKPNELFGFIGPDGAGKTTLFRILTSLILPDSGKAHVGDFDVLKDYKKIRQITGYMPGRFSLYFDLTVEENLRFYAKLFNTSLEENYDLIEDVYKQIEPFKKRRAGALSGGMKQKLALSCALIHRPQLLILDEPTTGVDAVSRKEFWDLLKKMQQKGITILVSTPYMDEAAICDRVALMQTGSILTIDSPENIVEHFQWKILSVKSNQMYPLLKDLGEIEGAEQVYRFGESIHLFTQNDTGRMKENILTSLSGKGYQNLDVEVQKPVIEDCFLALMDKSEEA
ncbi:MAG: ABC transporter ATP-binding protein [Bacteroidales bacterium]|nr:ABC transporter ATP-binding protein [Bacteroidales bacterium]